jgi:hypothetical protein
MNRGLLSISATCSHCEESHTLGQCIQQQIVTPTLNWPTDPGSTNIEFKCPVCDDIIHTYKVR